MLNVFRSMRLLFVALGALFVSCEVTTNGGVAPTMELDIYNLNVTCALGRIVSQSVYKRRDFLCSVNALESKIIKSVKEEAVLLIKLIKNI